MRSSPRLALPPLLMLAAVGPSGASDRAAPTDGPSREDPPPADVIVRDVFPATGAHPRYSEGSVAVLDDGALLYATTEFIGGGSDFARARIVARTSRDGGRAWGDLRVLQENVGRQNVMSVSLLRFRSDDDTILGMFYLVKNSPSDLRVQLRTSSDDARSFGDPTTVTAGPGYHVMNNDRVRQLASGRLVCPVAWTRDVRRDNRFVSFCFLSDDAGRTWRRGPGQVGLPRRGAMEPDVVELRDGRLLMILRTQLGEIWATRSSDGGETWDPPFAWGVACPEAPATLRRVAGSEDLLLVWNPDVRPGAGHGGPRTPLVAALSSDEGRTWGSPLVLEGRSDRTYAYTSATFRAGRALLTYYVRDEATGRISSRFRSLPLAALRRTHGGKRRVERAPRIAPAP